jgi:DNA-binding beta-propeller fold protein YncE
MVGRHPRGLAIMPDGAHALVALNGDSAIAVVALAAHEVARRIPTAAFPYLLAVSPNGKRGFVTHNGYRSRLGTPLDLVHWRARAGVRTGLDPAGVAFDRFGRNVVVANTGAGTISVLDAHTGRRRRRLTPAGSPRSVAVSGARGYVADGATGRLTTVRLGGLA